MKRRYYHGTTLENFKNMVASNFATKNNYTWKCSSDDYLYLWDLRKSSLNDSNGYRDEITYTKKRIIQTAFGSAQLTAAVENVKNEELVVIEFCLDEKLIEDDTSCKNMILSSRINMDDVRVMDIKNVYVAEQGYKPSLRLVYCLCVFESREFKEYNFSDIEITALKALSKTGFWIEELLDVNYKTLNNWNEKEKG